MSIPSALSRLDINNRVIGLYIPVSYISSILAHSYQPGLQPLSYNVNLLSLLTAIFTGIFLYCLVILKKLIKNEHTSNLINLFGLTSTGIARGFVMFELGELLSIDSGLSIVTRVVVSASATFYWLGIIAYFTNSHQEYKSRYRSLLSKALLFKSLGANDAALEKQISQVEGSLKSIQIDSSDESLQSKELLRVAEEVKAHINNLIRPASQRLWLTSITSYPKIRFRKLVFDALKNLNYSIPTAVFLAMFLALSTFPTFMPLAEMLVRLPIIIIGLFAISYFFNRVRSNWRSGQLLISLIQLIALSVLPVLAGDYLFAISHYNIDRPATLSIFLIVPVMVIGLSIISLINLDQNRLTSDIESSLQELKPAHYQSSRLASYLHNSLQSELLAIAKRLEVAAGVEDERTAKGVLEQLGALINRSISDDFNSFVASPQERLSKVLENWRGIVEIDLINPDSIFQHPLKSIVAIQIIEELASNAVKHAANNRLEIKCSDQAGFLFLEVYPYFKISRTSKSVTGSEVVESFLVTYISDSLSVPNEKLVLQI